jgi:predicted amidohydrolase YtcJ
MREALTGRLSVGEFIALYEQAQDYVAARAKEVGQIPPGARSDEVIFEFGRRVEKRVRQGLEREKEPRL